MKGRVREGAQIVSRCEVGCPAPQSGEPANARVVRVALNDHIMAQRLRGLWGQQQGLVVMDGGVCEAGGHHCFQMRSWLIAQHH
jgi:hypothetical protein